MPETLVEFPELDFHIEELSQVTFKVVVDGHMRSSSPQVLQYVLEDLGVSIKKNALVGQHVKCMIA